jgi:hypothetical protein
VEKTCGRRIQTKRRKTFRFEVEQRWLYHFSRNECKELGKENWKIVKLGDKQVNQLIEKQDIKIYPNPVSDYAYVEIGFDFKKQIFCCMI